MEKQKLNRVSNYNSIKFEDAKQKLVDFLMLKSTTNFLTEDISELLPAFYSYCNHKFKERGTHLPKINYNAVSLGENATIAYVGYNELNINIDEFDTDTELTPSKKLEILDILFHEHTHLADYNNNSSKTNLTSKPEVKEPLRDECFDVFEEKLENYHSNNNKKTKITTLREKIFKSFIEVNYKQYFLSAEESRARRTANEFVRDILDEATKQNINTSNQFMLNDLEQALNDYTYAEREEEEYVSSFKDTPELKDFLTNVRGDFLSEFESLVKEFKQEYTKDPDSYESQTIAESIEDLTDPLLLTLTCEMYDEQIANDLLNSYIELGKDNKYFQLGNFSNLISTTKILPTQEQMIDIAKCFRQKQVAGSYSYNPLDSFITAFNFYDTKTLLDIFMIDNPDFSEQLEFYSGLLVDIDDKTKMNYQRKSDTLQKKAKPTLKEKVKGGFEELFKSMKKENKPEKSMEEKPNTNNPLDFSIDIEDNFDDTETLGLE